MHVRMGSGAGLSDKKSHLNSVLLGLDPGFDKAEDDVSFNSEMGFGGEENNAYEVGPIDEG